MIGVHFEDSLRAKTKTYVPLGLLLWTPNLSLLPPTLPHLNLLCTTNGPSDVFKTGHFSAQKDPIAYCPTKNKIQYPHGGLYDIVPSSIASSLIIPLLLHYPTGLQPF